MRNVFANYLVNKAKKNKKIYFVVADISPSGNMEEYQSIFKNRFINVGVAEQTMIGVSAGLSMSGKIPFAYTIATFSLYRPFEMIRNDLAYQNIPVTVVGMGSGTVYANLGGTHLTQEDISIARSIPNMKILNPCDPSELKNCIDFCINNKKGPIYLKIGKAGEKTFVSNKSENWIFGKIRKIKNGSNVAIISSGPIIKKSFEILEKLKEHNVKPSIYSCHTLKPFDYKSMDKINKKYKKIITIEDHSEIGGIGSICKGYIKNKNKVKTFSLKDEFIHSFHSQDHLLKLHGIENKKIIQAIIK